jgi:hypothetical protein
MVWIGSIWPRIGTGGGLMWLRWWTSGFRKMLGSSRVAAQLAASQEGLSSVSEWVPETNLRPARWNLLTDGCTACWNMSGNQTKAIRKPQVASRVKAAVDGQPLVFVRASICRNRKVASRHQSQHYRPFLSTVKMCSFIASSLTSVWAYIRGRVKIFLLAITSTRPPRRTPTSYRTGSSFLGVE